MRMIFQRVGDADFKRPKAPTWLFLDEFVQAGRIESLLPIAEIARGKDLRLVLACQDIARIRDVYGRDSAESLANMIDTKILGRTSGSCAQWASDLAGKTQMRRYSRSITTNGDKQVSIQGSYQRSEEPVFRTEDFGSELGTHVLNGATVNRLLVLAGGNTLGLLDWPLTILPRIAAAHVSPSEPERAEQPPAVDEAEPESGTTIASLAPLRPEAGGGEESVSPEGDSDKPPPSPPPDTPRERLRRRRAAGGNTEPLGPREDDL